MTDQDVGMFSNRPYLVRAFYEWIVDNGCTPYIVVAVNRDDVKVPMKFVQNDEIVLDINPEAVLELKLGNRRITFNASFGGEEQWLNIPLACLKAIYAKENGQGMMFSDDEDDEDFPPEEGTSSASTGAAGASHLRLVD
jgi:stringent starvation protein B